MAPVPVSFATPPLPTRPYPSLACQRNWPFPAVLFAGLLGGLPAGIIVTVAGLLTVWWAFIPPGFHFFPLAFNHGLDLVAFLISCGCVLAITERYRASLWQLHRRDDERELLMKELEHRGKNTYAVIDALVRRTLEHEPELAKILSGRIRAIRSANNLLNYGAGQTVSLNTLLLHEFTPYWKECFCSEGPDVQLSPDVARLLSLVFHEMVTNAVKHGALSKPGGRVLISWKNEDGLIRLEWKEVGGPMVSAPGRQGLGSRIIIQSLKYVSGFVISTFAPEGLTCSLTFRAQIRLCDPRIQR